jgi:cell volume regulation protein A
MKSLLTEIVIPENSPVAGKQIVHLGLPPTTLITFILRGKDYITPSGATVIEENDKLFVLSENKDSLSEVFECLEMKNN